MYIYVCIYIYLLIYIYINIDIYIYEDCLGIMPGDEVHGGALNQNKEERGIICEDIDLQTVYNTKGTRAHTHRELI